ncbi:hypothetical protein [Nostoc sphaeroides]|uniref:Uncharacterized protein n=1 Tax=Nostoc sphaeroides CCNUC1 TaxID=2653204 RepID=A0A5P8WE59_9NOSO|nr:hypothetical protein [Nostoc sphaeroides]QFS51095.1 hypothetical protein GXM_08589 [Nostoc sphaeroides CCNUC1]
MSTVQNIQQSSDRFIINSASSFVYPLLFILHLVWIIPLFVLFPAFFLITETAPRQQILNCTHIEPTQVKCRVQEKTIIQTNEQPPIQLTGAEVIQQEGSGDDGIYTTYQIQLYSKTKKQDFGYVKYTKEDEAELKAIVSQINVFIANPNQRILQVRQQSQRWVEMAPAFVFLSLWEVPIILMTIFGIIWPIFFALLDETWDFDTKLSKLTITKLYPFQKKTVEEYSLLGEISLQIGINCQIYLLLDSKKQLISNLLHGVQIAEASKGENIFLGSPKFAFQVAVQIQQLLNFNKESEKLTLRQSKYETWNFDRNQHKLTVAKFPLSEESEYSLLGQVSLQISNSEKDSDGDTTYELHLIFDSGNKLTLYSSYSKATAEEWRDVITEFLKLNN